MSKLATRSSGLYLLLGALAVASVFIVRSNPGILWTSLFICSIILSFVLIYLGGKDVELMQQSLYAVEEEKKQLVDKCAQLCRENIDRQNAAIALHHDLENARNQLAALKAELEQAKNRPPENITPSIIQQEDTENGAILQSQYDRVRQQLEEKSEALHLARKALFQMENDFLTLQREQEERGYHESEEELLHGELQALEGECRDLEGQVDGLQELISSLLVPKARSRARTKKTSLPS